MPLEPTGESEQEDALFVVCLRCDEEVDATSNYCPECGASLDRALNRASAVLDRSMPILRRVARRMWRNPIGFLIRFVIFVVCFGIAVRIVVGIVRRGFG